MCRCERVTFRALGPIQFHGIAHPAGDIGWLLRRPTREKVNFWRCARSCRLAALPYWRVAVFERCCRGALPKEVSETRNTCLSSTRSRKYCNPCMITSPRKRNIAHRNSWTQCAKWIIMSADFRIMTSPASGHAYPPSDGKAELFTKSKLYRRSESSTCWSKKGMGQSPAPEPQTRGTRPLEKTQGRDLTLCG